MVILVNVLNNLFANKKGMHIYFIFFVYGGGGGIGKKWCRAMTGFQKEGSLKIYHICCLSLKARDVVTEWSIWR